MILRHPSLHGNQYRQPRRASNGSQKLICRNRGGMGKQFSATSPDPTYLRYFHICRYPARDGQPPELADTPNVAN